MTARLRPTTTTWALLGLLTVGAFLLPLASASPAPGISSPNPNAPAQQWAYGGSYGASSTGSLSGWGPGGNWSYTVSAHGFFGWNVILTQTNTSTTTFTLQEQRTVVAAVYVSACSPSCSSPSATANLTVNAWEVDNAFANFTTQGTVYVNGTIATQALALENAQSSLQGNDTAVATWQTYGTGASHGDAYLSAAATANAQVAFTPSLGLVPMTPVPGSYWNSSAAYTSSGSFDVACHYDYLGLLGFSTAGSCGASGSLTGSGTVALMGADLGRLTVGGILVDRLTLGLSGAHFRFVDGAILVPASADLMGGAGTTTSAGPAGLGVGTFATSEVDFSTGGSHVGVTAAKAQLTSSAASGVPVGDATTAKGASASPAAAAAQYGSQGQPESVAQAQSSDACLMGSCSASASPATHWGLTSGELLLVGAVGVIALVGAVIWVSHRPRSPPSGTTMPAAPSSAPPAGAPPTGYGRPPA